MKEMKGATSFCAALNLSSASMSAAYAVDRLEDWIWRGFFAPSISAIFGFTFDIRIFAPDVMELTGDQH